MGGLEGTAEAGLMAVGSPWAGAIGWMRAGFAGPAALGAWWLVAVRGPGSAGGRWERFELGERGGEVAGPGPAGRESQFGLAA